LLHRAPRFVCLLLLFLLLLLATGFATCPKSPSDPGVELDTSTGAFAPLGRPVSYEADVKPVLENRCVVCHACWDAPCQLQLSSIEGIDRGATKDPVYDSSRFDAMPPTRLFFDEQSTQAWRHRGFFPVLGPDDAGASNDIPLLLSMLALARAHPVAEGQRLPDTVPLDIDRKLSCPTSAEFDAYAREHPAGGMPRPSSRRGRPLPSRRRCPSACRTRSRAGRSSSTEPR